MGRTGAAISTPLSESDLICRLFERFAHQGVLESDGDAAVSLLSSNARTLQNRSTATSCVRWSGRSMCPAPSSLPTSHALKASWIFPRASPLMNIVETMLSAMLH